MLMHVSFKKQRKWSFQINQDMRFRTEENLRIGKFPNTEVASSKLGLTMKLLSYDRYIDQARKKFVRNHTCVDPFKVLYTLRQLFTAIGLMDGQ